MKQEKDYFNWNNVSGDKYYNILDILKEDTDDVTKKVDIVSILTGIPEDELWDMPIDEVSKYFSKLEFLKDFKIKDNYHPKTITISGKKYVVEDNYSNFTLNQFVDYQNWAPRPIRESYDKIISIFLIPEGKKYGNDYSIEEVQKDIRENVSWPEVQSLLSFFITRSSKYILSSLSSLMKKKEKITDPTRKEEMNKKIEELKTLIRQIALFGSLSSRESATSQK